MKSNEKIIKYNNRNSLNIGVFVFIIIIIYVSVNIFLYATSDKISVYEVQQGSIASNNIYKGFIIRDEEVVTASNSGFINYYWKNAQKASVTDLVCSIDTDGALSKQIDKMTSELSQNDLYVLSKEIDTYMNDYSDSHFYNLYIFKDNLSSSVTQAINQNAYESLYNEIISAQENNSFYSEKAPVAGIIMYYVDGFEGITEDQYEKIDFNTASYTKDILNTKTQVNAGDPIFKVIKSELWNIIVPIPTTLAEELSMDEVIRIRFCNDNRTAVCTYTIMKIKDSYCLNLALTNSMVRYAKERFMNVELILDDEDGLKIPNSSITTKEFYTVPRDLFLTGTGSIMIRTNENGIVTESQITPEIYFSTNEYYYLNPNEIEEGTVIIKPNSQDTYILGSEKSSLTGVYNINKGYAIFKQINILYQNEEYSIVKSGQNYGLVVYDHIALDGSKVKEGQVLTR